MGFLGFRASVSPLATLVYSYIDSLSIYLPIYLSTYLPIYLSTYLSIYLSIYLPIYLSTYISLSMHIHIHLCSMHTEYGTEKVG